MTDVRTGSLGVLPLDGRVALVTGASSGIGAATARALADAGVTVLVGYFRGAERAADLAASLPSGAHRPVRLPLGDPDALADAATAMENSFGRCDILVNSAGSTRLIPHSDLEALDPATFSEILTLNVTGPYSVIRAFARLLHRSDDAVVVNVSSLSGTSASGSNIAYCAAKAAVDNLTMSLARSLGPSIRVLGVAPAAVDTGFVPGRTAEARLTQASATPLKIAVQPEDVATSILGAITHLRISTGTTLLTDSGRHL